MSLDATRVPLVASGRSLGKNMKRTLLIMLAMASLACADTNRVSRTEIRGRDTMIDITGGTNQLVIAHGTTNDLPSSQVRPRLNAPAITLRDAINLAETYIATNSISTDGFWLKEVKLIYPNKTDIKSKRWHILWVNEDAALGHTISIMIDMNGRIWRMGSL